MVHADPKPLEELYQLSEMPGSGPGRETAAAHRRSAKTLQGGEHMIYCCEDCAFLFQRVGEIDNCPSCDSSRLRFATQTETETLRSLLKPMEKNKEEEIK